FGFYRTTFRLWEFLYDDSSIAVPTVNQDTTSWAFNTIQPASTGCLETGSWQPCERRALPWTRASTPCTWAARPAGSARSAISVKPAKRMRVWLFYTTRFYLGSRPIL